MLNSKWGVKRPPKKKRLANKACNVIKKAGDGVDNHQNAISKQQGGDVTVTVTSGTAIVLGNVSIALPVNAQLGVAGTGGSIIKEVGPGSVYDNDEADGEFDLDIGT